MITLFSNGDTAIPCTYLGPGRRPVDITGATIRAQVRRKLTDPAALLTISTDDGIVITDGPAGRFQLTFSAEAVAAALAGAPALADLPFDIVLAVPGGRPVNLGATRVALYQGVTR
jgi:hypothetical protein